MWVCGMLVHHSIVVEGCYECGDVVWEEVEEGGGLLFGVGGDFGHGDGVAEDGDGFPVGGVDEVGYVVDELAAEVGAGVFWGVGGGREDFGFGGDGFHAVVADEGVVEAFCGVNVGVLEVDELDFGVGDGKTPVEVGGDEGVFGAPVEPVGAGLPPAGFEVGHDGVPEGVDEMVGGDPVVVFGEDFQGGEVSAGL